LGYGVKARRADPVSSSHNEERTSIARSSAKANGETLLLAVFVLLIAIAFSVAIRMDKRNPEKLQVLLRV
jgi:hypothetical protein